jgi:NTP pyrophosphatase (non-canonical NTP hydrolase)
MELKEAQARVDAWIGQFEEGYWPPLVNLARLTEEVGELARLMNHRFGPKRKKPEEEDQDLGEELADVLFVLLVIANQQGIDLADALDGVLEKYRLRDSDRWKRKADVEGAAPSTFGPSDEDADAGATS